MLPERKIITARERTARSVPAFIRQGFSALTDGLKEIAELRLEYPDSSLQELGKMLDRPISKSGVNHRLKKLSNIANEIRQEKENMNL